MVYYCATKNNFSTMIMWSALTVLLILLPNDAESSINDRKQNALTDIDQTRIMTIHRISRMWRKLTHQDWERVADMRGGKDVHLLEEYKDICDVLDEIQEPKIPELVVSSIWSYAIIEVEANGILELYKNFRRYQQNPANDKNQRKWQDFAENVVEDSINIASVNKAMDRIDDLVVGNEDTVTVYKQILEEAETNLCNVQQSPQQLLYNIYLSLQMTQLKGYTMMQFAWMLLRLYDKGNFTLEATKSRENFIERMRLQVKMAKKAMSDAEQSLWRCDPSKHVEDETFTEITRLLQGYIVNEVDLNPDVSCIADCGYFEFTKEYGCFKNKFCSEQRPCKGDIVNCKFIDSDMTVCTSDIENTRYNWVKYNNGVELGDTSQSCKRQIQVDSWWRYLFYHCSYCFCLCDDSRFSDRYINLRSVTSDIENNKVVTALRFIKYDHIIHLQIQEGVLLSKGVINESTLSWRSPDEYVAGETGVKDQDYAKLSWNHRGIDFDEIKATKPNQVMTGIKFRNLGTHLNLEIRLTPFNFATGKLIEPNLKSEWVSNDNTDGAAESPRTEIKLDKPDVPIILTGHKPISRHDTFMLFTHTDMDKDVAQHTVPYLDTQIVGPDPPTPLSGAGLILRGMPGSGGYIAPKVFTYDYALHLEENFDDEPDYAKQKYDLN